MVEPPKEVITMERVERNADPEEEVKGPVAGNQNDPQARRRRNQRGRKVNKGRLGLINILAIRKLIRLPDD